MNIANLGGNRVSRNEKVKITVNINNKSYTIIGNESASHVRLVASLVDQKMHDLQIANEHLDTTKLAVLTAVNTMNDYLKLKEEYTDLQSKIKKEDN